MFNFDLIKKIASGAVGYGVSCIVEGFVETMCPDVKGVKKVCISLATGAIAAYATVKVTDHMCAGMDETMNGLNKSLEDAKAYIEKVKNQEQEGTNG